VNAVPIGRVVATELKPATRLKLNLLSPLIPEGLL